MPRNSIAQTILANLAYASREMRLDQLLIKDATAKLKALEAFHSDQVRTFEERLRWLHEPD